MLFVVHYCIIYNKVAVFLQQQENPTSKTSMEGNIGQKCDWIVPHCFVFGDAMDLPVRYYVVPGRMLYRNSDGIISYPVIQLILRHAIISYPMMICRTQ